MAWLAPIAAILDGAGARWTLIGALAAARYRLEPRLTADLDLLAEPVSGIAEAFRDDGFVVHEVADTGEPPHLLLVRGRGMRVDVLLATVDYQRVALDRSVDHVLSAEDVIVHKLIAWRNRDRDDILSILRAGHTLDEPYIEQWAQEWEVTDRWAEATRSR